LNSIQNTDLEPPIYRLQETLKTAENRTLSVDRPDGIFPRPDGFLRYPSETAQFYPYQGSRWSSLKPLRIQTKLWSYLNYWISSERIAASSGQSGNTGHRLDMMPSRPDRLQRHPK
jgi:hypothetical protein